MSPRTALHALIWLYAAIHAAVAAWLPLAAHEAHYALYAWKPQLSYVDHPPLTAWLQAPALWLGDAPWTLRILPLGLMVWSMYLLAGLARRCSPDGHRWLEVVCVAVLQGTLVFHIGVALSPDGPLLVLALLLVGSTLAVLERDRLSDWLKLGVLLGLVGLTKYTGVTLAVSVVAILMWRRGWHVVIAPRLWATLLIALVIISPVLIWNVQHGWITLDFHLGYQVRTDEPSAWTPLLFLTRQLEQVVFYSPLLYVGGLWVVATRLSRANPGEQVLYVFALPVLALFTLASLTSRGSAHWSLVGWLLLIPPVAQWLIDSWRRRLSRALVYASATFSAAVLLVAVIVLLPGIRWPDFSHPMRALVGWQQAAERASMHLDVMSKGDAGPILLVRNWHHAERLAWYARPRPVQNVLHKLSPYSVMFGQPDGSTRGILTYPHRSHEAPLARYLWPGFECVPIDELPVHFGASLAHVFFFYRCEAGRAD